jgi:hypothetical protein
MNNLLYVLKKNALTEWPAMHAPNTSHLGHWQNGDILMGL